MATTVQDFIHVLVLTKDIYSFSPKHSAGFARPWLGDFENVVFEAGKKATRDGMLWGPTCLFCMFFGWNFIAGFYAFVYTVYEKRDRKDFGVKAGRGENILRGCSYVPQPHGPHSLGC